MRRPGAASGVVLMAASSHLASNRWPVSTWTPAAQNTQVHFKTPARVGRRYSLAAPLQVAHPGDYTPGWYMVEGQSVTSSKVEDRVTAAVLGAIGHALALTASMTWEILWALHLGLRAVGGGSPQAPLTIVS